MTRAHHLSGSKVDLALHGCLFWARPDTVHPARPMGAPAKRGVTVHTAFDRDFKGLALPEFHDDTRALWDQLKTWLMTQPNFTHSELPLLYDAENDTAAICETGEFGERDYLGVTALKVPMRLDLVRVERDVAWVLDVKTGSRSGTETEPANMQLASGAVAVSRLFGVERVKVGLVFPLKTKVHPPAWFELDADALDLHAGKLHRALKMLPTSGPVRGDHCWKCPIGPSKGYTTDCPAWQIDECAQ